MPNLARLGIRPITVIMGQELLHGRARPNAWTTRSLTTTLAGLFVLLMGCAELSQTVHLTSLFWARLMLPAAMLLGSVMLLVGSNHEPWPIRSLSFAQT